MPAPKVLLASASNLAPAAGPWLIFRAGDGAATLHDELGGVVPTQTLRSFANLSLCEHFAELVRPGAPLATGEYYTLSVSSDYGSDDRRFKATARAPETVERFLRVVLDHSLFDGELYEGGCAHPKFNGLHAKGFFQARVETDTPALVFVELSVADSSFDELSSGGASLDQGMASQFAVSNLAKAHVPQLDTTADCAHVVVRDSLDTVLFDRELCPEPGKGVEATNTVSLSEHLVRESSPAEDEGCSCRAPRGRSTTGAVTLLLGALLLRRWRGRRGSR
jgi:hypothetical protein